MNTIEMTGNPSVSSRPSTGAVSSALSCLALGLRDGLRPRIALTSVFAGAVAFFLWLTVYSLWWSEIWEMAESASRWALFGLIALVWPGVLGNAPETLAGASNGASLGAGLFMTFAPPLWGAVQFLVVAGSFVLLIMFSVRLYLEFFLMARVQRECLKHYPSLKTGVKGSLAADFRSSLAQLAVLCLGVLLLVIPLLGGMLFFLLASYLNVRGLVNDALDDIATVDERRILVRRMRWPMLALGVVIAVLFFVPLAGLFMPAVLAASVCHLSMRSLEEIRAAAPMA